MMSVACLRKKSKESSGSGLDLPLSATERGALAGREERSVAPYFGASGPSPMLRTPPELPAAVAAKGSARG